MRNAAIAGAVVLGFAALGAALLWGAIRGGLVIFDEEKGIRVRNGSITLEPLSASGQFVPIENVFRGTDETNGCYDAVVGPGTCTGPRRINGVRRIVITDTAGRDHEAEDRSTVPGNPSYPFFRHFELRQTAGWQLSGNGRTLTYATDGVSIQQVVLFGDNGARLSCAAVSNNLSVRLRVCR